jgi:hypothetical protein
MNRLTSTGVFFASPPPVKDLPLLPGRVVQDVQTTVSPRGFSDVKPPIMVGEFQDEQGRDYVMLVNLSLETSANIKIDTLDPDKAKQVFSAEDGRLSPLDDRDLSELDLWLQARFINMAREAAKGLPQDQREAEVTQAQITASSLTWMSGQGAKLMATVDGMARIVWQGAKHNHPDLSYEECRAKMFDPTNVEAANDLFAKLNVVGGDKGGVPKKPDLRARLRKSRRRKSIRGSRRSTVGLRRK